MDNDQLGERIVGCALRVHRAVGPGLLENAYETLLAHELAKIGLGYRRQPTLPVRYDGVAVELGYRLDLLVEDRVVVEVKSVERIMEVHRSQLLSYLKLGGYPLGYLINFNSSLLKDGVCRMINRASPSSPRPPRTSANSASKRPLARRSRPWRSSDLAPHTSPASAAVSAASRASSRR